MHAPQRGKTRIHAIGHGTRTEMSSADALEIAAKAHPESPVFGDPADPNGRKPGDVVGVMPDDYGKIPVHGEIVSLSAQHIAIRRSDQRAGDVVRAFPARRLPGRPGLIALQAMPPSTTELETAAFRGVTLSGPEQAIRLRYLQPKAPQRRLADSSATTRSLSLRAMGGPWRMLRHADNWTM